MRVVNSSSQFDQILGSTVVEMAETFESFMEQFPPGSTEKLLLENGTRRALIKPKIVKILNGKELIPSGQWCRGLIREGDRQFG